MGEAVRKGLQLRNLFLQILASPKQFEVNFFQFRGCSLAFEDSTQLDAGLDGNFQPSLLLLNLISGKKLQNSHNGGTCQYGECERGSDANWNRMFCPREIGVLGDIRNPKGLMSLKDSSR